MLNKTILVDTRHVKSGNAVEQRASRSIVNEMIRSSSLDECKIINSEEY
jgi:hypothetical protein